jgi:hypothetical protein
MWHGTEATPEAEGNRAPRSFHELHPIANPHFSPRCNEPQKEGRKGSYGHGYGDGGTDEMMWKKQSERPAGRSREEAFEKAVGDRSIHPSIHPSIFDLSIFFSVDLPASWGETVNPRVLGRGPFPSSIIVFFFRCSGWSLSPKSSSHSRSPLGFRFPSVSSEDST